VIPEPTTILWTWLRTAIDTTFPVWVDENAAFRLRAKWNEGADALDRTITDANAGRAQLAGAWRDAPGLVYQQKIDLMLNSPVTGFGEVSRSMRELGRLAEEYGRNIVWIKDQIYAELAANGFAFALSFGVPGLVGDWIRRQILSRMAARIAQVVATAATNVARAANAIKRVMPGVVRQTGNEMLEGLATTAIGHELDQWRGQRDGTNWPELWTGAQAEGLGALISRPLAPIGAAASLPARVIFRNAPARMRDTAVQGSGAFVVNGISSPVSGTFVQAIADGKDPWLQDYLTAIAEQGLGAGALGSSRVGAHHAGEGLRELISPRPPSNTGIGGADGGYNAAGSKAPDPDGPHPPLVKSPAAQDASQDATQVPGSQAGVGQQGADLQTAGSGSQAAELQRTADALQTGKYQPADGQQAYDGSQSANVISDGGEQLPRPPLAGAGAAAHAAGGGGTQNAGPAAIAPHPDVSGQASAHDQSAPGQQSAAAQPQGPAAGQGTAQAQASGQPQGSAQTQGPGAAQTAQAPGSAPTHGSAQAQGQGSTQAQGSAQVQGSANGQGAPNAQAQSGTGRGSSSAAGRKPGAKEEGGDHDAERAAAVARGVEFAQRQTVDFVPDLDGVQGPDGVVPPDLMPGGFGPVGPLVAAAVPAAPTGVPLAANAVPRGPVNSGNPGPVHTTSSRSADDESGKPEGQSGPRGPIDDDPPPPAKPGPAGEADDQGGRDAPVHGFRPVGKRARIEQLRARSEDDRTATRAKSEPRPEGKRARLERLRAAARPWVADAGSGRDAHEAEVSDAGRDGSLELTDSGASMGLEGTAGGRRITRWFAGNRVTGPVGAPVAGQSVVLELRVVAPVGPAFLGASGLAALGIAVDPSAYGALEAKLAELVDNGRQVTLTITRVARPSADSPPYRFTVDVVDAAGNKVTRSGYDLSDVDPDGPATAVALVTEMITDQQSPAGRHRPLEQDSDGDRHRSADDEAEADRDHAGPEQTDVGPHDDPPEIGAKPPAPAGPSPDLPGRHRLVEQNSGGGRHRWAEPDSEPDQAGDSKPTGPAPDRSGRQPTGPAPVQSPDLPGRHRLLDQDSDGGRHRTVDDLGSPRLKGEPSRPDNAGQADGRSVIARALNPDPVPHEAAKPKPDWSHGPIPAGVHVSPHHLGRLDDEIQRLRDAGQEVDVHLLAGTGPDGRPELMASVRVIQPAKSQPVWYRNKPIKDMIDVLASHRPRLLSPHEPTEYAEPVSDDAQPERGETRPPQGPGDDDVRSPEDILRGAARLVAAEDIARQARRLAEQTGPGKKLAEGNGWAGDGEGRVVNSPAVPDTRYHARGRGSEATPLTPDLVARAADHADKSDFGGLIAEGPTSSGRLVVVRTPDGVLHHFRAEEPGAVDGDNLAQTSISTGARHSPHRVTVAPGVADDQLTRLWVHEISHTLQELQAPRGGPLRRLWNKLTGGGHNACVEAQQNEFRYLTRQWAAAVEAGDAAAQGALEVDLAGLADAIAKRGGRPPDLPQHGPPVPGPIAQLKAAIAAQAQALDSTTDALNALVEAKKAGAREAGKEADKESKKAGKAEAAKDQGRFDRKHRAEAERDKQRHLEKWYSQLQRQYEDVRDQAAAARDGYRRLLTEFDASTPEHVAAEATRLAASVASYDEMLLRLGPSNDVMPSLMPRGSLPHLTALAERINVLLGRWGIDERVTAAELQHRLSAMFGNLVTKDGAVLRLGRDNPADLRIRLSVDELVEVANPPVKASEIIIGRFPQPARRLATSVMSAVNYTVGGSLTGVVQALASLPMFSWLEPVTVKVDVSHGNSRAVTANAGEIGQYGAVEDNRGESVLFSGKASYQLDIRTSRERGWSAAEQIGGDEELRGWLSHAYTVPAATKVERRKDLWTGRLPAHMLTSIDGLEALTDKVIAKHADHLRSFGAERGHVEDQIQAILTQDLPGRLGKATDHETLRPLRAGGKHIGYLRVKTTVREEITLVGAQSRTHWQEAVRVGASASSVQQNFGGNDSENVTVGYGDDQLSNVYDTGYNLGPSVSAGRSVSHCESLTGGGTTYHVGVHRFIGPTQGYRMVLDHDVELVFDGQEARTTSGRSEALLRVRVNDAYRHGLPVDEAALVREDGLPGLQGDVQPGAELPGRKQELPGWCSENGVLRAAGPWNIQEVTGGEQALEKVVEYASKRGFIPPLDGEGNLDLSRLSRDPVTRHGQLLNLEELRRQLSPDRLETGYDIAARDGIVVTLTLPGTTMPTKTLSLRIGIEQSGSARFTGVTTDEAVVLLNIGSDTAGRSGGRGRALPLRAGMAVSGPNHGSQEQAGPQEKAAMSYERRAFGRALSWIGGGTINQVTLVESNTALAVFEVPHVLTVTDIGTGEPIHEGIAGSARLLIDGGFLPYDDAASPTHDEQPVPGTVSAKVLDRAIVLAMDTGGLIDQLPAEIRSEPTALQQISAFLNPRNLLSHPEWARTGYRTTIVVAGPGGVSRRIPVTLAGRIRDARRVGQTAGTAGDINFALSSHGISSGRTTGANKELSTGAVGNDDAGAGIRGSRGSSASTSSTDQSIWGVERLTIEVGRHDVFEAVVDLELTVGDDVPATLTSGGAFQLAERDALRFYVEGTFGLSLHQVADAVERYLEGDLNLDRRAATQLIRRYRVDLARARAEGRPIPELASRHSTEAFVRKLWKPIPHPQKPGSPVPHPDDLEAKLEQALSRLEERQPRPELPPHYREHLGASLIESADLSSDSTETDLVSEVRSMMEDDLGIDVQADPALAQALDADLAGKRWWGRLEDMFRPDGRLEDMFHPGGFVRHYVVGTPGELTADQVTVRIRAEFDDGMVTHEGEAKDVVTIVQRYLYRDQTRTRAEGRSTGGGADVVLDESRSYSAGTDLAEGRSTTVGDQLTRLERLATFDGVTRFGRPFRVVVEVTRDAADPTRGAIRRALGPEEIARSAPPRTLAGKLVQLVPTGTLPDEGDETTPAMGEQVAVREAGPAVVMPATFFVHGVGPTPGQPDLPDAVLEHLGDNPMLGTAGARIHRAEVEHLFSASSEHAKLSDMASPEGYRVEGLPRPGSATESVDVTVRARFSNLEQVGKPFEGELGDVNRSQRTVTTSTTTGRLLPLEGAANVSPPVTAVPGRISVGAQAADTTTDTWGSRDERSRFERGKLVLVRARVDYDLTFTNQNTGPDGATRAPIAHQVPSATTAEAYLFLHEHDYHALTATQPRVVHSPEIPGTRYVSGGRPSVEGVLKPAEAVIAALATRAADFGGLITGRPAPVNDRLIVVKHGDALQYFGIRIGEVPPDRMATTELRAGSEDDPHVVTFGPGTSTSQLPRVWVHEISHTLQELRGPGGGPVRRLAGVLTTGGQNACVDAQYNEFRYLVRHWFQAVSRGEPEREEAIRHDAEGLARAIEARGYPPPPNPWLTEEEVILVYEDRFTQLLPPSPPQRPPGTRPRVFLIGGQPGAGKTTTQGRLSAALQVDSVGSYDFDDDYTVHPRYDAILREWGTAGTALIARALPEDLHQQSLDCLRAGDTQYDVIFSFPFGVMANTRRWIEEFREFGYHVSMVYVATDDATSLLGMADRYQSARDAGAGGGRWVEAQVHDILYAELPDTAHALEAEGLVDDIYVVTRGGDVLYENHQDAEGDWEREIAAREAILAERERPPTPEERARFELTVHRLLWGRADLPPLERDVRGAVEDATRREDARPEPRPDTRDFDDRGKLDNRLDPSN
jgi:hypothetical protein